MPPELILKAGKDKPVKNYHHWIFSGAVKALSDDATDGSIVQVFSSEREILGSAYVNRASGILGRMVAFGEGDPIETITDTIEKAVAFRQGLFDDKHTTAYRLVNAEGDRLPGLIVDRYGDYLAIQIATLGMEKLKPLVLETLHRLFSIKGIYEKSSLPARREEGLKDYEGPVVGNVPTTVEIKENGLTFLVDIAGGQKTGFFLDQREMRSLVRDYAKGRRLLNCFSYTGGFSVSALAGGALRATSVDISEDATKLSDENAGRNAVDSRHQSVTADLFEYLRESHPGDYDFIILDPPAFVKRKIDIVAGCRGYKDINRLALKLLPERSYLLTSSCSYFVDEKLFQQVVFQAAREADRRVRIISHHRQAPDHPINIYHPEGEYLKSLLLYVD